MASVDVRAVRADHGRAHFSGSQGALSEEYSPEELEFQEAMDRYKRVNRRPFPAWSEVFAVLLALGYRRVAEAGPALSPSEAAAEVRLADRRQRVRRRA